APPRYGVRGACGARCGGRSVWQRDATGKATGHATTHRPLPPRSGTVICDDGESLQGRGTPAERHSPLLRDGHALVVEESGDALEGTRVRCARRTPERCAVRTLATDAVRRGADRGHSGSPHHRIGTTSRPGAPPTRHAPRSRNRGSDSRTAR